MPSKMHNVMGELSWESLSQSDQSAWGLSARIPDDAPEFIRKNFPSPVTVKEKAGFYSHFLDAMGWKSEAWLKTPEYLLNGRLSVPHGGVTPDLNSCAAGDQFSDPEARRIVMRQFVPCMIEEIQHGRMEKAFLYWGLLAHFIQDGLAMGHIFPNRMFYDFFPDDAPYHRHYHQMIDSCNPELKTVRTDLLGTSVAGVIFRLGMFSEQNEVAARRAFFPMLEACRRDDKETMNCLAKPFLQSAVFQCASLLHTAVAIGQGNLKPKESERLKSLNLVDAVGHTIHLGGKYAHIIRGHNVVDGKLVPLRIDLGNGPETIENGLGMTSFNSVRYLLEPGAFSCLEGSIALSCEYLEDQEPDMDVEFFIGLDKEYNRIVSSELNYGPGMKKVYSVRLKPDGPAQHFSIKLGNAKTLLLAVLPRPVNVNGQERCPFPHIVVAYPRLNEE